MTVDWKGALPLIMLLFAVGAMGYGNVDVTGGVFGALVAAVAFLLLVPVLAGAGVSKDAQAWFVKAGAFGLAAAAFIMVSGNVVDVGGFSGILAELGIALSALMALIGALTALK